MCCLNCECCPSFGQDLPLHAVTEIGLDVTVERAHLSSTLRPSVWNFWGLVGVAPLLSLRVRSKANNDERVATPRKKLAICRMSMTSFQSFLCEHKFIILSPKLE